MVRSTRERSGTAVRHMCMDDDMRPVEDDRSETWSEQLHATAEGFVPDTAAALEVVRASPSGRRRRVGVTVTAAAASIALVAVAALVVANDDAPTQLTNGSATQGTPASKDSPSGGSDRAQDQQHLDATLTVYRYPNAAPGHQRLMAVLHTPARTYYSGDLPDSTTPDQVRFGPDAAWEYGYGDSWAVVDGVNPAQPDAAIQALLDERVGGPPNEQPLAADSNAGDRDSDRAGRLMYLISTGSGSATQVTTLAGLLRTIRGVQLQSVDGLSVIHTPSNGTLTYAPDTGKPVRWEWDGTPEATIEFVASYRVDSSKLLDPAAAQSTAPPELPSTTTTSIAPVDTITADTLSDNTVPAMPVDHPSPTVAPVTAAAPTTTADPSTAAASTTLAGP